MRVRAETDGQKIFLEVPLSDSTRPREVPGGKWDSKRRVWRYPLSWATCVALRGVFGDQLDIGPGLLEWATAENDRRVRPAMDIRSAQ